MRGHRHSRRAIAICVATLWLLGVEVLPNLHLAFHGDDHTHGRSGEIVTDPRLAHALAHFEGVAHDHDAPRPPSKHGLLAFDIAPHGHAAAGIAHRAAALLDPPPPITTPLAVPHAETWRHLEPTPQRVSIAIAHPTARGPPV